MTTLSNSNTHCRLSDKNFLFKIFTHIILIFALSFFVIISFYSRPCVDDYSYSSGCYHLIQSGNWTIGELLKAAFQSDMDFYQSWQGLYTSAFILSLQPGIFGEQYYFIGSLILMAVMYISLYYTVRSLSKGIDFPLRASGLALLILIIILEGLPSTVQGMYWFNGAWNYIPFFFLTMVNITLVYNYFNITDRKKMVWYILLSSILSFIISGGNHVTAFLNILLLFFVSIFGFFRKKRGSLISLAVAVFGFIVVVLAPGTAVRQDALQKQSVISTVFFSAFHFCEIISDWIDIQWVLTMIIATIMGLYIVGSKKCNRNMNPLILFVISIVIICGILCVPYYAMGSFGDGRVTNIYWMTFMMFSVVNWMNLIFWISNKFNGNVLNNLIEKIIKNRFTKYIILISLLGICFNTNTNTVSIAYELYSGNAQNFAAKADERYAFMKENPEIRTMIVEELPNSKNLKFDDVTEDVDDWRNKSWKEYYGVQICVKDNENR